MKTPKKTRKTARPSFIAVSQPVHVEDEAAGEEREQRLGDVVRVGQPLHGPVLYQGRPWRAVDSLGRRRTASNVMLACAMHNAHFGMKDFGAENMARARSPRRAEVDPDDRTQMSLL